jgi:hypothetical protein
MCVTGAWQSIRRVPRGTLIASMGLMPKRPRADITEQFFTAGELMEAAVETDHFLDLDGRAARDGRGLRAWLALAAASAVGLLVLVVLTI